MNQNKTTIAIIGAGMGGLTAASLLLQAGFDVQVYEQARAFTRLGAGIQMSPNAMKVLRAVGLEERLRQIAFQPPQQLSRVWDTGDINLTIDFGETMEKRYGAPYLLMHRGDLHSMLNDIVPRERVHLSKRLTGLDETGDAITLHFADGSTATAAAVIGADGVHSLVREILLGQADPVYSGRVAYRTTFPASLIDGEIDDCTKWWGPDRHIVIYYITHSRDEVYFVTSVPEPNWTRESWSMKGDLGELRAAFEGFHPQVRAVLDACPDVHKWAISERSPLPSWGHGRIVLLGDACHPMTPYMAQGAATSMEDAAVLTRCLTEGGDRNIADAFKLYEHARKPRTAEIQQHSHENKWLHRKADTDWVYGYDAWKTSLAETAVA